MIFLIDISVVISSASDIAYVADNSRRGAESAETYYDMALEQFRLIPRLTKNDIN
jgi:hypothetical protein